MANILRQLVARPRAHHHEANLDLCYVTDNVIATSGPSATYPKKAYRNPLPNLLEYLNKRHPDHWMIWEFRAEGTGYPDSAVDNRIWHFPWPDHHPPPFKLIPRIVASMRDWRRKDPNNVVVVHCKAGKGRSGTASCAYLMSEEDWDLKEVMERFTERRMRSGWGSGISIPSQQRYLRYVDRWRQNGKVYVQRKVRVLDIRAWGLRDGVRLAIDGFIDEGKKIKTFHTFDPKTEMEIERGEIKASGFADAVMELMSGGPTTVNSTKSKEGGQQGDVPNSKAKIDKDLENEDVEDHKNKDTHPPYPGKKHDKDVDPPSDAESSDPPASTTSTSSTSSTTGADVLFTPKNGPILLETSDVCLDLERRTRGTYTWAIPTSVAHVWFNTWFEGQGPETITQNQALQTTHSQSQTIANLPPSQVDLNTDPELIDTRDIATSGVFEIEWSAMDGLKGSSKKGTRAFDRVAIRWEAVVEGEEVIEEPREGEEVKQERAADWRQREDVKEGDDEEGSGEEGTKAGVQSVSF